MSKDWYYKHWKDKETPEFIEWFVMYYGTVDDYDTSIMDEVDEDWVRRGFALMGWLGAIETNELKVKAAA